MPGGPRISTPWSAASATSASRSGSSVAGGGSVSASAGRPAWATNRSKPAGEPMSRTRAGPGDVTRSVCGTPAGMWSQSPARSTRSASGTRAARSARPSRPRRRGRRRGCRGTSSRGGGLRPAALAPAQAADVVGEADEEEEEDERDPDGGHPLVRLAGDRAAANPLDEREGDMAAVERQEREQVEEREREADEREHEEELDRALLDRLAGDGRDADDARDLAPARARDDASERATDRLRHVPGGRERAPDRRGGAVAPPLDAEGEAEPVRAVRRLPRPPLQRQRLAAALDAH